MVFMRCSTEQVLNYTVETTQPEENSSKPEHFLPIMFSINLDARNVELRNGTTKEKFAGFSLAKDTENTKDFLNYLTGMSKEDFLGKAFLYPSYARQYASNEQACAHFFVSTVAPELDAYAKLTWACLQGGAS